MIFIDQDFKTIQIALTSIALDRPKEAVYRFLLPKLLSTQTDSLPTQRAFNVELESLYGAYFRTKVERIGQYSVMQISMTCVDPKIVKDNDLLDRATALFKAVLFEHQTFDEKRFQEEKRLLIEQWTALYDKKRYYANHRFNELFYHDDPEGYPITGTLEDIQALELSDVLAYYQSVFLPSDKIFVTSGRLTEHEKIKIETVLDGKTFESIDPVRLLLKPKSEEKRIIETTVMQQAIIKMGYVLPVDRMDHRYPQAILIDTILGGYPESILFKQIREEKGLCYDIGSSYHPYKGTLVIGLGVDPSKRDVAIDAIQALILDIQTHGFKEETLAYAKAYVTHQLKMSLDHQGVLTRRIMLKMLFGHDQDIETRIQAIMAVTPDEIHQLIQLMTLDTVYVLTGGESS